jgi:tRNA-splicing ligase RtcB
MHTEEEGCIAGADTSVISPRAKDRGKPQIGTLGSGNHFLEVQQVDKIFDSEVAKKFGIIEPGQVTVMIHCGSRGLGYQIADDYISIMLAAARKYGIDLPDNELACAPLNSAEARNYVKAMYCAVNYAFCNRQMIAHWVRETFNGLFKGCEVNQVYDVCHNIAKFEEHKNYGRVCVHRKGATRAFPPGHPDLPDKYKNIGQPVIIPGDMGRNSYLLVGTKKAEETFYSTCHGAGRVLSRSAAIARCRGRSITRELADKGIVVMASGRETLAEEAPEAYKNVNEVVGVVHGAGISKRVCRMRPLGVIKG